MNLLNLHGKIAVVTGGAKGIGAATARMLERAGAHVTVFDVEETDGFRVDVTSEPAVKEAFARVAERSGGVDILVNNAGRVARKPAIELSVEEWQKVMDVNLTATFVCSTNRASLHESARRRRHRQRGVDHGSVRRPLSQRVLSGVEGRRRESDPRARARVGGRRHPRERGGADVREHRDDEQIFSNPDKLNTVMQHTPLGRLPEADDVAAAILYLCSDAARCVTGIVLPVDSGYLAR